MKRIIVVLIIFLFVVSICFSDELPVGFWGFNFGMTIDEVLQQAQPMLDELAEEHKQFVLKEGKRYSKWDGELFRLSLIFDLTKALSKYLLKTDEIKNIDLSIDKGVITIFANVIRDKKQYYIGTQMIYAGGYNIQRLHYRYIMDTNLPKVSDSGALDNIKEYKKKLTKKQRIEEYIQLKEKALQRTLDEIEEFLKPIIMIQSKRFLEEIKKSARITCDLSKTIQRIF